MSSLNKIDMVHLSLYFLIPFILLLVILRGRAGHLEYKVRKYLQKNHPEKAGEFGCEKGGWFNEFKLVWSLYKKEIVEDPEFTRLKNKTKNALTCTILTFLLGSLFIIFTLITLIISKR